MRELSIIKASINTLKENERTSKEMITVLAVETVERLHQHDDVDTLNLFILALSDANRRMVLHFAKEFSGHKIGEDVVGRRSKPYDKDGVTVDAYSEAKDKFINFVQSGMTIWQWAFAKRDPIEKPIDIVKAGEQFRKKAEKAIKAGVSKLSVFEAATGGLFSATDMLTMLTAMMDAEQAATDVMNKAQAKAVIAQASK